MTLEERLNTWTDLSSPTEKTKQKRTERMIEEAITAHAPLKSCTLDVYAKGSYANQTNVKADSDVDIVVQCKNALYYDEATPGCSGVSGVYDGEWSPYRLRTELEVALRKKFPDQIDNSGSIAIKIASSSARVDADVVPCFDYRYYWSSSSYVEGTRIFRKNNSSLENYPAQQLSEGATKDTNTLWSYKATVRILKRVENLMAESGFHHEVPSFFVECLTYNCPNRLFIEATWTNRVRNVLIHLWGNLAGSEPQHEPDRWLEANNRKFLFDTSQPWTRSDGKAFAKAAWNYLGYGE
ncbi:nucleotidyltransferase [Lentzea sp. NPDC034063]|uniref:nucleotidyltransferase domain-containing protein n=1 Tax=unclassified Lentzea TaxID=2643253 RepID=UPI0033D4BCEB